MVLPNSAVRNRALSFTARGILAHLLSLPDGAKEDVRTLADRNHGLGRRGVAKALEELVDAGYYVRHTIRDPETGRVWTETAVYDTPQVQGPPLPVPPGTGSPSVGDTGTLPTGVKDLVSKDLEKAPSLPSVDDVAAPVAPSVGEGSSDHQAEAVDVLARLEAVDGRLRLSGRQLRGLAPLAAEWLARGYSAPEVTDAVVQGLPARVYAPAKLVADRLIRKRPAPRREWASYAECGGCRGLLPAGQSAGVCGACAGATAARPGPEGGPDVEAHAASIRAALRTARQGVAA